MNIYIKILHEHNRPLRVEQLNYYASLKTGEMKTAPKIAQALYALKKAGKIKQLVRGVYALPHWEIVDNGIVAVNDGEFFDTVDKENVLCSQLQAIENRKKLLCEKLEKTQYKSAQFLQDISGVLLELVRVIEKIKIIINKNQEEDYEER